MLPTKLVIRNWSPPEAVILPDQIPAQWHSRFEAQDLTGKTLAYEGLPLLVKRDVVDGQERILHCEIRFDLMGVPIPKVLFLEPLTEEEF